MTATFETKFIGGIYDVPVIGQNATVVDLRGRILQTSPVVDIMYGQAGTAIVTQHSIYYLRANALSRGYQVG